MSKVKVYNINNPFIKQHFPKYYQAFTDNDLPYRLPGETGKHFFNRMRNRVKQRVASYGK